MSGTLHLFSGEWREVSGSLAFERARGAVVRAGKNGWSSKEIALKRIAEDGLTGEEAALVARVALYGVGEERIR